MSGNASGKGAVFKPTLAQHVALYEGIECDYRAEVETLGLPFASRRTDAAQAAVEQRVRDLASRGVLVENGGKSLHRGWISPACIQCRKGLNTLTLGLSTQCPRNCYFCFNANQRDHDELQRGMQDACGELTNYYNRGAQLEHIALTGGEPLVHKSETIEFFDYARKLYPHAYMRLYTSGAYLDEEVLRRLRAVCLDEIRLSIKLDESESSHEDVLALMVLAARYIPNVMVEMPVAPDWVQPMRKLLVQLDAIGVKGINLLEFCYPLHNAHEFLRRGYAIKNPPYRVYYDYEYAGGLPIAGSEEACLDLFDFAIERNLSMGCHYCSLENKFTSQLYLQNAPFQEAFPLRTLSEEGYFLESAKAFGEEAGVVARLAKDTGAFACEYNERGDFAEFPLHAVPLLCEAFPDMPIGISVGAVEVAVRESIGAASPAPAQRVPVLRELKLEQTTPRAFCAAVSGNCEE
ncbi:radical SAM protein [Adlercreutzia sp. R7]|uniref:Radical SAM protein n=1 Tax=Adlercreutzia wanghongyangiae TaxID=3111451 RepID=A0ABU6IFG4_9ACTN|nr:radical SAM protein [Adlercreutzia sp. R7]